MKRDLAVILQLFLSSARLQKKRATLTIASLAWGTVTILLLLAFGEGLKRQMMSNDQAMGNNMAIMWPGETSKPYKGLPEGRPIRPKMEDIDWARERLPELDAIWGEYTSWRTALTLRTEDRQRPRHRHALGLRRRAQALPQGSGPLHQPERRGREAARRVPRERDGEGHLRSARIRSARRSSSTTRPSRSSASCSRKRQSSTYGGPDATHAVIPAVARSRPSSEQPRLNVVVFRVHKRTTCTAALKHFNEVLGPRLGYDPEDPRVWGLWDTVKGQKMQGKIMLGLELFFGVIGALTLIIGGVGVANIMYAVVKERTKEIGVKMALGARRTWITGPFILEGLVYTLVGGLVGALIAILIVTGLSFLPIEGNDVLEFMGRPTLSWPIGIATHRDPGHVRPARRLFPGAPGRLDRSRIHVEVRVNGEPMSQSNAIIDMQAIRKVYDTGKVKVEALKGIDLDVDSGEFVAIVGPSGSGKSTLMNLIGCLDTPTDGTYRLGGEDVSKFTRDELADVRNRRVGFVFQGFNLLPQITAFENVEMPLLFGGVAPKKRRERVEELMTRVGLGDRMDHKPTELSGGQMQRVAIARALAMHPDVVLADEPTGNLDTSAGGDIMGLFTELWKQGSTLVVITHDMTLARRASRIVEIRDGRIVRDGEAAA